MNYGKLVRAYRKHRNMTMEELADGLCDKSYIYRIEKGLRTPSFQMMIKIATKLNFSLLDVLVFNDYDKPIAAGRVIENLAKYRQNNQFDKILITYNALHNSEFMTKYPTKQYLNLSLCYAQIYSDPQVNFESVDALLIKELNSLGYNPSDVQTLHTFTPVDCHLLLVYAALHKTKGDVDICITILESILSSIENKKYHLAYGNAYIIATIDYIHAMIIKARQHIGSEWSFNLMKSLKNRAFKLEQFQINTNAFNRLPLTYMYLYYFLSKDQNISAETYKKRAYILSEIQGNKAYKDAIDLVSNILKGSKHLPFPYVH